MKTILRLIMFFTDLAPCEYLHTDEIETDQTRKPLTVIHILAADELAYYSS